MNYKSNKSRVLNGEVPEVARGLTLRLVAVGCSVCNTTGRVGLPADRCANCDGHGAFSVDVDAIPNKKRWEPVKKEAVAS